MLGGVTPNSASWAVTGRRAMAAGCYRHGIADAHVENIRRELRGALAGPARSVGDRAPARPLSG